MAPAHEIDQDPSLRGGEWLFRRGGEVFGPVDSRTVAAMLYRGEIDGGTPLSSGDGAWTPAGEVPVFLLHVKKAEAGLRVERELTGARRLQARRSRLKAVLTGAAVIAVVIGAAGAAFVAAERRGAASPLLEDFGDGIGIVSAARVDGPRAPSDEGIELPREERPPPAGSTGRSSPGPAAPSRGPARAAGAAPGDLHVVAHYDPAKIQAVVAREQRTLVPCFREEAARSPEFSGEIPIEFAVANDGRVATLWIDDPRFRRGPLEACLRRALDAWRFESFPGQRPTVSLAFRIGR